MAHSYETAAALKRYRLVSVNSSGKLIHCAAGGMCVGSLQEGAPADTFASGTVVSPSEVEPGEEAILEAGEALAAGEMFKAGAYGGNDGYAVKDATKTVDTLGLVLQAATDAGQKIRVVYAK